MRSAQPWQSNIITTCRWQRQQQALAERAAKDAAAALRRASVGAQRQQAHSLQFRLPAAKRALHGKHLQRAAAPVAVPPDPAAAAVRRLLSRAPGRSQLGRAGLGEAGLRGSGKAAARAGRAKPAAPGGLASLGDPDVAVLQPEQLAMWRTLVAVGASATRRSDPLTGSSHPVKGPSLASACATAACGAHSSQGLGEGRAGPRAGRQHEAAGFGLPAIYQRMPAQVRRTAAGQRENTDPNPKPYPVAGAGKSSIPSAATAAPAEARAVSVVPDPTLPAATAAAPAEAWIIPAGPEPASRTAPRAENAQGRALSSRVSKARGCGAGRKAGESKCQSAPAALPAAAAVDAARPAPSAADAAAAAGKRGAKVESDPAAQPGSSSLDKPAVAGEGRPEQNHRRSGANPEPTPPPRPAWLLGGASGSWEAAGRESCLRGTPLWGDLWRGPDLGQVEPDHAGDALLYESAGPPADASGLRICVTVHNRRDESQALARDACQVAGAGSAGDAEQERAECPGAGPSEGGAHALPGSPAPAAQGRSAMEPHPAPLQRCAVRSDPCCGDNAEGEQAARQVPGAGTLASSLHSAAMPTSDLRAGGGSEEAQARGHAGTGGAARLEPDPTGAEADGVTAASECTTAALTAALAALEREASGDDLLGLGLNPSTSLPRAAGAPSARAGMRRGTAVGERRTGNPVPGTSRGAAAGEAYASLESLEAAVVELAAGLGQADAERLLKRLESEPGARGAAAVGSLHPDGLAVTSASAGCGAAGSGSGLGRQGGDMWDVLFPEAAGGVQGSGYLAGLETLAESADWGAGAAALDALVDELEALAAAAGAPSGGGCAPADGLGQVGSLGGTLQ